MSENKPRLKPVAVALGAAFATSFAAGASAETQSNPFALSDLESGYQVADSHGPEGKCGGEKGDKEGRCGGDKEGKADKEGKCGGDKEGKSEKESGEGKCGEGKCGGK